eukprot:gene44782-21756_t
MSDHLRCNRAAPHCHDDDDEMRMITAHPRPPTPARDRDGAAGRVMVGPDGAAHRTTSRWAALGGVLPPRCPTLRAIMVVGGDGESRASRPASRPVSPGDG